MAKLDICIYAKPIPAITDVGEILHKLELMFIKGNYDPIEGKIQLKLYGSDTEEKGKYCFLLNYQQEELENKIKTIFDECNNIESYTFLTELNTKDENIIPQGNRCYYVKSYNPKTKIYDVDFCPYYEGSTKHTDTEDNTYFIGCCGYKRLVPSPTSGFPMVMDFNKVCDEHLGD